MRRRLTGLLCALAGLFVALPRPAPALPAVWTVHGPRGELVIFGSVHLLPDGPDWRPPALTAALARADDVWFELPINQTTDNDAARLTTRRGRLPAGDSLWAHLSPTERARLERAARGLGLDPATLGPLRPWMADLLLSLAQDARAGARAGEGVEAHIQNEAPPSAARRALETVREQVGYLAGGSMAEQITSLDETVREIDEDPGLYGRMIDAWRAGDVVTLKHEALDPVARVTPGAYRTLIVRRNRRWAQVMARLAATRGVHVVVVGAGHLLGPDGLPTLLRRQGLTVSGP